MTTSWGFPSEKGMRWCGACAKGHPGSVDKRSKKCEDCREKWAGFGLKGPAGVGPRGGRKARWCAGCAKNHPDAMQPDGAFVAFAGACVDCKKKHAQWGRPAGGGTRLWCGPCAKESHPEAVPRPRTGCEDYKAAQPVFGLAAEGRKVRWCHGCAKAHAGAVNKHKKMCEGCGVKSGIYGDPDPEDRRKRWCTGCAHQHPEAVLKTKKKLCEECKECTPSWGLPASLAGGTERRGPRGHGQANPAGNRQRWCTACAKGHPGAVITIGRRCEDCAEKWARFALDGDAAARWCRSCGLSHAGARDRYAKKGESCHAKTPKYGMVTDGGAFKPRWCSACASQQIAAPNAPPLV